MRRDLAHDKVEQPLTGGGRRDANLADAARKDLADVQPRQRAPGHVERKGLGVHHDDAGDACGRNAGRRRFGWVCRHDDSDDQHEASHGESAAHEGLRRPILSTKKIWNVITPAILTSPKKPVMKRSLLPAPMVEKICGA